jgi:hypothetical protein
MAKKLPPSALQQKRKSEHTAFCTVVQWSEKLHKNQQPHKATQQQQAGHSKLTTEKNCITFPVDLDCSIASIPKHVGKPHILLSL